MQIKFDEKGNVLSFAEIGGIKGAIDYVGDIPEGFREKCGMYKLVDGKLTFDEEKAQAEEKAEKDAAELQELIKWFDEYDNQVRQYERSIRLGDAFDRDIKELDKQARENQKRIRELRG